MVRTTKQFLEDLYQGCTEGFITITKLPGAQNQHFPVGEIDSVAEYCEKSAQNTYYGTALRRSGLAPNQRGKGEDITSVVCMYADIDILGPAHKQKKLPATSEEAESFLNSLSLPPSYLIDSGNGLHAIWLLEKPFEISSEDDRNYISSISLGFGGYLIQEARRQHDWILDNVQDIARMLRMPGTPNLKTKPSKRCRIIGFNEIRYSLSTFEAHQLVIEPKEPIVVDSDIIGSAERMRGKCAFIDYCIKEAETLSEPWWHALLSIVSLTEDGPEMAHKWSSPYYDYNPDQTDERIRRAITENKPCSCEFIRGMGFNCPEGGCQNCGKTVGGPIAFAFLSREEQVERLLEAALTVDEALTERYLDLVRYAKEHNPAQYIRLKKKYQKLGIGVRDLENSLKVKKESTAQEDFFGGIELEGIDTTGLTMPDGWEVKMTGITHMEMSSYGMIPVQITASPVVISRKLEDLDDGSEKLELAYYRDHHWKYLVLPRGEVMDKGKIIRAADQGLPVFSANASKLVNYLAVFEVMNDDTIKSNRSIDRLGWVCGMKEFYPFHMRDEVVFEGTTAEASRLVKSIHSEGDETAWMTMAVKLRTMPFARTMLAASFASILLAPLQQRIIYLHLWKDSRSGKSAAQKAAISIWGDPAGIIASYNSTQVGFERTAAAMNHLPLALDELQSCTMKPDQFSRLVYMLGNGIGRMRGDKYGGTQELLHWRNVILSTGEQPIITGNAMDGVVTRVIDLCGAPIPDEVFAADVHRISESNFGFAGDRFIQWLFENYDVNKLKAEYTSLRSDIDLVYDLYEGKDAGFHLDNATVIALADSLSSQAVFGIEKEQADQEAISLAVKLLSNIHSQEKADSIDRAWEFVCDWTQANKQHFEVKSRFSGAYQSALSPVYGRYDPQSKNVFFIPNCFYDALRDGGYSIEKCYQGFKERGYIDHVQKQIRVVGDKTKAIRARIDIGVDEVYDKPEEEAFLA